MLVWVFCFLIHKAKQVPLTHLQYINLYLLILLFFLLCPCSYGSLPTTLLMPLLSHSLKHVSYRPWTLKGFFIYFKISCAVSHLQFALPSQCHFSSLFLFCNVGLGLLSTQRGQLLVFKQIFFFFCQVFWTQFLLLNYKS